MIGRWTVKSLKPASSSTSVSDAIYSKEERLSTVYITSHNGVLNDSGDVLYYRDYLGNLTKLLPDKVNEIVLLGRTTITSGAFMLLFRHNIGVVFLSRSGKYTGRLVYSDKKNTLLRHRQHMVSADEEASLRIAKDIVAGKLYNQYCFMKRIARKSDQCREATADAVFEINRIRKNLESAETLDEIRGYEGDGSRLYFSVLGEDINCGWTTFKGRSKNPPLDEVNAVLSLLYTVLANRLSSYIHTAGLDPGIGTLHSVAYGRESLVFDLVEEFRTPIADTLTCSLFNMGVLKKEHFRVDVCDDVDENDDSAAEGRGAAVLLNEEGFRKVLEQFERKISETHYHKFTDSVLTYDQILREQVLQYRKVIAGLAEHYIPVSVK